MQQAITDLSLCTTPDCHRKMCLRLEPSLIYCQFGGKRFSGAEIESPSAKTSAIVLSELSCIAVQVHVLLERDKQVPLTMAGEAPTASSVLAMICTQ